MGDETSRPRLLRYPREWWRERRAWELSEDGRAGICKYSALVEAALRSTTDDERRAVLEAARQELRAARDILDYDEHRRMPLGSHITAAQVHISAAKLLWLQSFSARPQDATPYLEGMRALVREHLGADDPHRIAVEKFTPESLADPVKGADNLVTAINAVEVAQSEALREKLRAASFVHIVWWVTGFLFFLAVAIGGLATIWPDAVPLCFTPARPPSTTKNSPPVDYTIVCPASSSDSPAGTDLDANFAQVTTWGDYIVVEIIGLVAAGVAAASALRRIRGTSTPYQIPVALAALKLPAGALTAVLGLLLMRGGFVPGLTALDNSAQIIAWAIIFGYSQELFTKFVDRQGQVVLDAVHGPASPRADDHATPHPADP